MSDPDNVIDPLIIEEPSKEEREAALLSAMGKVIKILEPLTNPSRRRVLRAVIGFYELKGLQEEP